MRILAIDPGSALGWATNATGRLEWGTENFKLKNGESSGNRWRRFGEWLSSVSSVAPPPKCRIGKEVVYLEKIDLIVYEKSHFPSTARYAAEIAAGFTTRLEEHCERHGIALQPVAVQTLKAFAIPKVKRKKGDPKMDRGKGAMIAAAVTRLGFSPKVVIPVSGRPHWAAEPCDAGPPIFGEHEADALWAFWWAEENCK